MSSRAIAVGALCLLLVSLGVGLWLVIPWQSQIESSSVQRAPVDVSIDFSSAEIATGDEFAARIRVATLSSLVVGTGTAIALGFWPWGARLVAAASRPFGGAWWVQVLVGGLALLFVLRCATLVLSAWAERVRQDEGLSTRSWVGWGLDVAKGFGVNAAITLVALLVLVWLARSLPNWWWAVGGSAAAGLVVVVSFAYPLVIEPVFNKFTPMSDGALRTSLLELAERDGVAVDDVLVADASRRTTTLNAYVSGFGSTRRIVVYDTLLQQAPAAEVRNVVAHELGHADDNDVLYGTALGALGAAAAVVALFLLSGWKPMLTQAGVSGIGDGRALPLIIALITVTSLAVAPLQSLASRRVEARADVHALDLTHDPATLTEIQRRLALTSKSDLTPNPLLFAWFASHPSTAQRMANARTWAIVHGETVPPPLAPQDSATTGAAP